MESIALTLFWLCACRFRVPYIQSSIAAAGSELNTFWIKGERSHHISAHTHNTSGILQGQAYLRKSRNSWGYHEWNDWMCGQWWNDKCSSSVTGINRFFFHSIWTKIKKKIMWGLHCIALHARYGLKSSTFQPIPLSKIIRKYADKERKKCSH